MSTRLITVVDGTWTPGEPVSGRTTGHWRSQRWSGTYRGIERNEDGIVCHRVDDALVNGVPTPVLWVPVNQVADR